MLFSHTLLCDEIWHQEVEPCSELLLSWNVSRPKAGHYQFLVRLKTNTWSPWMIYAKWGATHQATFAAHCKISGVELYQDTISLKEKQATAFEVRVKVTDVINGEPIAFFAYTRHLGIEQARQPIKKIPSCELFVPKISQYDACPVIGSRICSPTSVTTVLSYLLQLDVNPLKFAEKVYDYQWDIYGNWVLNMAHAYTMTKNTWNCWVERLNHFNQILDCLEQKIPVVVSVQGALEGAEVPYHSGHLIVVCGWDSKMQEVICMDPASSNAEQCNQRYKISSFLEAWKRRNQLAYLFKKRL